jgi:hypothetical protein
VQQWSDLVDLAIVAAKAQQRDPLARGEAGDLAAEAVADPGKQRRGRNRLPQMLGENVTTCPPTCNPGT